MLISEYPDLIAKTKVMPQYAADRLMRAVCNGLLSILSAGDLQILNLPAIGAWPLSHKLHHVDSCEWVFQGVKQPESAGFCNVFGIRQYSKQRAAIQLLQDWAADYKNEEKTVIVYGMSTPILAAIDNIKQIDDSIQTCLYVLDLPQYMRVNPPLWYKILKYYDAKRQIRLLRAIDCFVGVTDKIFDELQVRGKPCTTIETIFDAENDNKYKPKDSDVNAVVYTGSIELGYGIESLLQAFEKIDDQNFVLKIAGNGTAVGLVQSAARRDSRIQYRGVISNKETMLLQREATLLVNPRVDVGEYTKYSFPSKTIEYLASGNPVLMHRLPGVPKEYDSHVYYFKSADAMDMAMDIMEKCRLAEQDRRDLFYKNIEFVKTKSGVLQIKKLVEFLRRDQNAEQNK
jgi:glycosyltransferase involved in cell wall biosynthesis